MYLGKSGGNIFYSWQTKAGGSSLFDFALDVVEIGAGVLRKEREGMAKDQGPTELMGGEATKGQSHPEGVRVG